MKKAMGSRVLDLEQIEIFTDLSFILAINLFDWIQLERKKSFNDWLIPFNRFGFWKRKMFFMLIGFFGTFFMKVYEVSKVQVRSIRCEAPIKMNECVFFNPLYETKNRWNKKHRIFSPKSSRLTHRLEMIKSPLISSQNVPHSK